MKTIAILRFLTSLSTLILFVGCEYSTSNEKPKQTTSRKPAIDFRPAPHSIPPNTYPRTHKDVFPRNSGTLLQDWFEKVNKRQPQESFGGLVARIARVQVSTPYLNPPQSGKKEVLSIPLDTFQCVSLVETSLAIARCTWQNTQNSSCFAHEVAQSRYRDGKLEGYGSRLHYFFDWLTNNADRKRLRPLSKLLGGTAYTPADKSPLFSIMTDRTDLYPALLEPQNLTHMKIVETNLNTHTPYVLRQELIAKASNQLHNGDLIAVVSTKQGLLISHTGFIFITPDGLPRFLHASTTHKRVVITQTGIADYINRDPKRLGILVYRPVAPTKAN